MNYFPFNSGDISVMTNGMDYRAMGIFVRLAIQYTSTEQPISDKWLRFFFKGEDLEIAESILELNCHRTVTERSPSDSDQTVTETLWHWDYFDEIIRAYHSKSEKARASSALAVAARKEKANKNKLVKNAQPNGDRTVTERLPNQEPITNNQIYKETKGKKRRTVASFCPVEVASGAVSMQAWNDWMAVRKAKRAPMTETAWERFKAEAEKAHLPLESAVAMCATRGWTSFLASWLADGATDQAAPMTEAERKEASLRRAERIARELNGGE